MTAPPPPVIRTVLDSWNAIQAGDMVRGTLALDGFSTTLLALILAENGCTADACLQDVVHAAILERFGERAVAGASCDADAWGESTSRPGLILVDLRCGAFTTGVFADPADDVFELRLPFDVDPAGGRLDVAADFMNSVLTEDYAAAESLLREEARAQIEQYGTANSCPPASACYAEVRATVFVTWTALLLRDPNVTDGAPAACVPDTSLPLADVELLAPLACGGLHPVLQMVEEPGGWRVDVDFDAGGEAPAPVSETAPGATAG